MKEGTLKTQKKLENFRTKTYFGKKRGGPKLEFKLEPNSIDPNEQVKKIAKREWRRRQWRPWALRQTEDDGVMEKHEECGRRAPSVKMAPIEEIHPRPRTPYETPDCEKTNGKILSCIQKNFSNFPLIFWKINGYILISIQNIFLKSAATRLRRGLRLSRYCPSQNEFFGKKQIIVWYWEI